MRTAFSFASIVLLSLFSATALAGTDVRVNPGDPSGSVQNEIRLAIDPINSNNMVTAYNDGPGAAPNPLGISYSTDGGATWLETQLATPADPFGPPGTFLDDSFDPYIAPAPNGDFYAGFVARPSTGSPGTGPSNGLFIQRSEDGGVTWSTETTISSDPSGSGPGYRFNDRPDMAVSSIGDLAVTWIKDVGLNMPTSDIYYSSAMAPVGPGGGTTGLTFSAPMTINDTPNGTDRGIAPDVAIHNGTGKVYVAWIDYDVTIADDTVGTIKIDSSATLGPAVFGPDTSVISIDPLPRYVSTTSGGAGTGDDARAQSYPSIAVDPMDLTGNTIFMTYAAEPSILKPQDEGDIFFTKSTDGGTSWSTPVTVNDDNGDLDQMHPAIAVKGDGTIDIVWYDKRNSLDDEAWDVYITKSTDSGASFFPNLRVSDTTFSTTTASGGSQKWLGEYLDIDIVGQKANVVFTSGVSDSLGDVYFDQIDNSAIIIPEPASFTLLGLAGLAILVGVQRHKR